jgi:hypothetical protein
MSNNLLDSISILSKYEDSSSERNKTTSGNYAGSNSLQYPSTVVTAKGYVVELIETLGTKLNVNTTDNLITSYI